MLPVIGGDEEDRTLDLTDANRTLSQLSYAPELHFMYFNALNVFCQEKRLEKNNCCDKICINGGVAQPVRAHA